MEAEILCEVALQADKSSIAKELLLMSLCLCPDYVPSLIALANMELLLIENTKKIDKSISTMNTDYQEKQYYSCIIGAAENTESGGNMETTGNTGVRTSVCGESQAYGFAMAAVRARELNPECWYILGRVYQVYGLFVEAGEAFSTAMEGLKHEPIRPFCTVLTDSLIRPLQNDQKLGRL